MVTDARARTHKAHEEVGRKKRGKVGWYCQVAFVGRWLGEASWAWIMGRKATNGEQGGSSDAIVLVEVSRIF